MWEQLQFNLPINNSSAILENMETIQGNKSDKTVWKWTELITHFSSGMSRFV